MRDEAAELIALARRFVGGDEAAFDGLAETAGRRAYYLALSSVANHDVAEEIAQEALVRVYRHAGELADLRTFPAWFYRIVLNLVHDHYRRRQREQNATLGLEEIRQLQEKAQVEPLTEYERRELAASLTEALGSLDEMHREVFLLKEVEGLSHARIAALLGIPEGTVWSRLSHARGKLREKLARKGWLA